MIKTRGVIGHLSERLKNYGLGSKPGLFLGMILLHFLHEGFGVLAVGWGIWVFDRQLDEDNNS